MQFISIKKIDFIPQNKYENDETIIIMIVKFVSHKKGYKKLNTVHLRDENKKNYFRLYCAFG